MSGARYTSWMIVYNVGSVRSMTKVERHSTKDTWIHMGRKQRNRKKKLACGFKREKETERDRKMLTSSFRKDIPILGYKSCIIQHWSTMRRSSRRGGLGRSGR